MSTALRSRDIIYESIRIVAVGIIVLHCNFHIDSVLRSLTVNNLLIERCLAPVQVGNKLLNSAFIVERMLMEFFSSPVPQYNPEPSGQESHLPEPLLQSIIIKDRIFEDLLIRKECHLRS